MTYLINTEMLGEDATVEQAEKMVELLQGKGYDVDYTDDFGSINRDFDENPIPENVWENAIQLII